VVGQYLCQRGAGCEGGGVEGEFVGLGPGEVQDGVVAGGACVGGGAEDEAVGAVPSGELVVAGAPGEGDLEAYGFSMEYFFD
jgi:hypothetical protein